MSVTSANAGEGGGGAHRILKHLWRHLVDLGSRFSRPLDLGGSIRLAFLDVFGATAPPKVLIFVKKYTAKVGEAKYIEKQRADRSSCFGEASILAATGFRRADPLCVFRCIWRNRKN